MSNITLLCIFKYDLWYYSVGDPEGERSWRPPPPPLPVQDPKNKQKRPDFGQNMLQNASFEASDFKIFQVNMPPGPSGAYKRLSLPAVVRINSWKNRRPLPSINSWIRRDQSSVISSAVSLRIYFLRSWSTTNLHIFLTLYHTLIQGNDDMLINRLSIPQVTTKTYFRLYVT